MDKAANQAHTARRHLETLCAVTPDRRPGSRGNSEATAYVAEALWTSGWATADQEFDCLDWETGGGTVTIGDHSIHLEPSPYGLGIDVAAPIRVLRTIEDLDRPDLDGAIVLLTGALAAEPLTPKAFPFYGSEEHAHIIAALERTAPGAVIAVTGRYPELCGALDPFPLIEDGDFTIPTANVRPEDARPLLAGEGASGPRHHRGTAPAGPGPQCRGNARAPSEPGHRDRPHRHQAGHAGGGRQRGRRRGAASAGRPAESGDLRPPADWGGAPGRQR